MNKIKTLTLVKAQKMSHKEVIIYVTSHPSSQYYKYDVDFLMRNLGQAEADSHLCWLILTNARVRSNLDEVKELSNENSSNN